MTKKLIEERHRRPNAGRKPKLTNAVTVKICRLIKAGHYQVVAATASGIGEATFYKWMALGVEGVDGYRAKYGEFREAVEGAVADSERILLNRVLKRGGPREALEVLKRRFPERWGDRHRFEHTNPDGETLNVNHSGRIAGGQVPSIQIVIQSPDHTWQDSDDPGPDAVDPGTLVKGTEIVMPGDTGEV